MTEVCKNESSQKYPIVLSCDKYNKILKNLSKNVDQQKLENDEKIYKNYLREGSTKLMSNWPEAKKDLEARELEKQTALEKKREFEKEEFLKIKDNDEKIRREKIAQAEALIQKLKPGPRELQSAAMLSEVLKCRNIQRSIQNEFETAEKERVEKENACQINEILPWMMDDIRRTRDGRKTRDIYKQEIFKNIQDREREKHDYNRKNLTFEKAMRERTENYHKSQVDKEREILQRKRETLRKNALEAMQMVEQRRLRDRIQDEVDNKLISVYVTGKTQIDVARKIKEKQSSFESKERNEKSFNKISDIDDWERREQESLQRDIQKANDDYFAKEQDKIQKNKAMKHAKIKEHILEVQRQKEAQLKRTEEKRFDMAMRMKNIEVDTEKDKLEKLELSKLKVDNRAFLDAQIREREKLEKAENVENSKCLNLVNEREDNFFFGYADTLLADAEKKERNTYPITKAIQKYKKDRCIDLERSVPAHLITNLTMGRKESEKLDSPKVKYGIDELKRLETNLSCVCSNKHTPRK
ncbi:hypothetical protein ACFFRR_001217 [Megaselia abdita]